MLWSLFLPTYSVFSKLSFLLRCFRGFHLRGFPQLSCDPWLCVQMYIKGIKKLFQAMWTLLRLASYYWFLLEEFVWRVFVGESPTSTFYLFGILFSWATKNPMSRIFQSFASKSVVSTVTIWLPEDIWQCPQAYLVVKSCCWKLVDRCCRCCWTSYNA